MSQPCRKSSPPRGGSTNPCHSGAMRSIEPGISTEAQPSSRFRLGAHAPSGMTGKSPCSEGRTRATDTVSQGPDLAASMNILLLGSGGREHALAWKIAASPLVTKLWCAPGNAGIAREAECVALDIADHVAVIDFCKRNAVDLVVVGPETPLVAGMVDDLADAGVKAFGPGRLAAQLEGSK